MRKDISQWLEKRAELTLRLQECPYGSDIWLQRAECHEELGYPDLAAGDAYRALLLTDEVLEEEGEYHSEAVEAIETRGKRSGSYGGPHDGQENLGKLSENRYDSDSSRKKTPDESWYHLVAKDDAFHAYAVLSRTLATCGDLRSAYDFVERGLLAHPEHERLRLQQLKILEQRGVEDSQNDSTKNVSGFQGREDLQENGSARRDIYAWNEHEPHRLSPEHVAFINKQIRKHAPKCEVLVTELPLLESACSPNTRKPTSNKQLGVFATADIEPNEHVLLEPSVLTASAELHDSLCDACSTQLLPFSPDSPLPSCPSCEDIFFCSQACFERAQTTYHPAVCRVEDFDIVAKDPSPSAATNALYALLVARVMAMAETQGIHPLDLPQTKYLWGDFNCPDMATGRTLPFSFSNNIALPLHLLARLDKNPFAPEILDRYDTWVINTLLAKFRATANAKMNERTGIPEIAGVHWLWCLANHSCAPNVQWEWEKGGMGLTARSGGAVVRWGETALKGSWKGGIKAGQEILNHYCDVGLPVKERREWAVGALGGTCMCERCCWEDSEH